MSIISVAKQNLYLFKSKKNETIFKYNHFRIMEAQLRRVYYRNEVMNISRETVMDWKVLKNNFIMT